METVIGPIANVASNLRAEGTLSVVRDGPKPGFFFWRKSRYVVYQLKSDGTKERVFAGHFKNHKEAVRAAYESLR